MIKLMLNSRKFNNYAFFCPVSRLHLTVSNPVGYVNEVTTTILKALKNKTILDVDGVVDIEAGTVKATKQTTSAPEVKNPELKNENNNDTKQDNTVEKIEEKTAEDKPKKSGKKANKTVDSE